MERTILIGDVHGCIDELRALLRTCGKGSEDEVVFVGDLVAKGPDSQAVVQFAREIGARGVRGNHDQHVLAWQRKGRHHPEGRLEALKPQHRRVAETLTDLDWQYLASLPLVLRLPEHDAIVVHGGFVPGVPLDEQRPEHLLNLRSITPDGRPSKRATDGEPWGATWQGPAHAVFGHDALRGLQQHPHATGLDTGCVYGKQLTALIFPERRLVHVEARRAYAPIKKA
jgi:predicted phosphodiesterase